MFAIIYARMAYTNIKMSNHQMFTFSFIISEHKFIAKITDIVFSQVYHAN